MKVLLFAPHYDRNTPGESWSTYKWVQGISAHCETTVLTMHGPGWDLQASPIDAKEIVNWTDPKIPGMTGRVAWELKPYYPSFYSRARRWLKDAMRRGCRFDVVHQINPLALRYPCPARGLGVQYVIGPLAGSLPTPAGFANEVKERHWFRKLREVDKIRLRYDPWLRSSYSGAALMLGVAPYVKELLSLSGIKRFEVSSETGVESVAERVKVPPGLGEPLKLLFVGRIIRTKGVIDAIRAVGLVSGQVSVEFHVLGDGDNMAECKRLISELGLEKTVHLHGRAPRSEVNKWYTDAHAFLFPSFREPSGNVVFEALGHGLPVITSTVGGPGTVVTEKCGFRVNPESPEQYARGLADCILTLGRNPELLASLSNGALRRMEEWAYWPEKITKLLNLYEEVANGTPTRAEAVSAV